MGRRRAALRYVDEVAVGQRIKSIRKRLGITQQVLGEKLSLKQASVNRYEKGRIPEGNLLAMIADLGGVTTDWLLKGGPEPGSESQKISEEVMEIASAFRELSERDQGALETSIQIIKSALDKITNYDRDKFVELNTEEIAFKLKDFMATELDALNQALEVRVGALVTIIQSKVKSLKGSELHVKGQESVDDLLAEKGLSYMMDKGKEFGRESLMKTGDFRRTTRHLDNMENETRLISEISQDEELKPVFHRFLEYLQTELEKKRG